jgi:hypothetical protein
MTRRRRRRLAPRPPLALREALRRLWRRRRGLMLATGVAALLALFFAARFLLHVFVWEGRRDEPLAPWMTVGYVARSYDVDRDDLAQALGLDPDHPERLSLAQIAARSGRTLPEVEAQLRAAIAFARGEPAPAEAP